MELFSATASTSLSTRATAAPPCAPTIDLPALTPMPAAIVLTSDSSSAVMLIAPSFAMLSVEFLIVEVSFSLSLEPPPISV